MKNLPKYEDLPVQEKHEKLLKLVLQQLDTIEGAILEACISHMADREEPRWSGGLTRDQVENLPKHFTILSELRARLRIESKKIRGPKSPHEHKIGPRAARCEAGYQFIKHVVADWETRNEDQGVV